MPSDILTFDASTVRRMDVNGNLHVRTSPITRVQVTPYSGAQIPHSAEHGFDPARIYRVYRPPEVLSDPAVIQSCVGIPVQLAHHADYAAAPAKASRVGSTGDDCYFQDPYLMASLHIQDKRAIDLINSGVMRELSLAYSYVPDFTPGTTPDGEDYDVRMTDIRANHVALVEAGRAGSSVMVLDSKDINISTPGGIHVENETATAPTREELIAKAQAYLAELGLTVADLVPPAPDAGDEDPAQEPGGDEPPEAPPAPAEDEGETPPEPAPEEPAGEPAGEPADDSATVTEAPAGEFDEVPVIPELEAVNRESFVLGWKAAIEQLAPKAEAPAEDAGPSEAEALAQEKLDAADECREELGKVKLSAFDSGKDIYKAALKQMGYTTEISDMAARDVYIALKSSRSQIRPLGIRENPEPSILSRTLDRVRVLS